MLLDMLRGAPVARSMHCHGTMMRYSLLIFLCSFCAGVATESSAETLQNGVVGDVFFAPGQAGVDYYGVATARDAASWLKDNPHIFVVVEGYASSDGSSARNRKLAQVRADEVRRLIVDAGGAASRVAAVSRGERFAGGDKGFDRRATVRIVDESTFEKVLREDDEN